MPLNFFPFQKWFHFKNGCKVSAYFRWHVNMQAVFICSQEDVSKQFALCTVPPFAGRALIWQQYGWNCYLTVRLWFDFFFSTGLEKNLYFPASCAKFPSSRVDFPPVWEGFPYVFIIFFPPNHKISLQGGSHFTCFFQASFSKPLTLQ